MVGLTTLTTRSQLIDVNSTVQLVAQFTNMAGIPVNLDTFPTVSIVAPTGLVVLTATTAGVMQLDVGKYQFNFTVPFNGPYGVWNDIWQGTLNGTQLANSFEFVVVNTDVPRVINSDGYVALGDDPGFNFSQLAIRNINKVAKTVKARLNNSGLAQSTDQYGNTIYVNCDIFSADMITTFVVNALSEFNQIPYFTYFTWEDTQIINEFHAILVDGAVLMALASQALIERGREYSINDNGVSFTPPSVAELLETQYSTMLTQYYDKLKYIKNSMRPAPHGLGTLTIASASAMNPQLQRLRHLRARQIF
jgi:hypothetical protein